jgi:WD40 repeat protein
MFMTMVVVVDDDDDDDDRNYNNSQFASCGGEKMVFLWDVASAQVIRKFEGHFNVSALIFKNKNKKGPSFHDPHSSFLSFFFLKIFRQQVNSVDFSKDGNVLASGLVSSSSFFFFCLFLIS